MVALLDVVVVEESEHGVAILELATDLGKLTIIGEFQLDGHTLNADGVHIEGLWAGIFGLGGLYQLGCALLRSLGDVDAIRIRGARRTTGKTAGRLPRTILITRSRCRDRGLA